MEHKYKVFDIQVGPRVVAGKLSDMAPDRTHVFVTVPISQASDFKNIYEAKVIDAKVLANLQETIRRQERAMKALEDQRNVAISRLWDSQLDLGEPNYKGKREDVERCDAEITKILEGK